MLGLKCGQCGAPIDVPKKSDTRKCTYCGSSNLLLPHAEPANDGEPAAPDEPPDPEVLHLQEQIRQLDSEWTDWRDQNLVRQESGEYAIVEEEVCIGGIAMVILAAGVVLGGAFSLDGGLPGLLRGAIFVIPVAAFCILILLRQLKVARVYRRSHSTYSRERRALVTKLRRFDA